MALREQVAQIWSELERNTAAGLDADEQQAVINTLARVEDNLAHAVEHRAPLD